MRFVTAGVRGSGAGNACSGMHSAAKCVPGDERARHDTRTARELTPASRSERGAGGASAQGTATC